MASETKKLDAQNITSILPLLAVIVILYGVTKQLSYYHNFNLDVFPFLEISEILPQTLSDVLFSSIYVILSYIMSRYWKRFLLFKEVNGEVLPVYEPFKINSNSIFLKTVFYLLGLGFPILCLSLLGIEIIERRAGAGLETLLFYGVLIIYCNVIAIYLILHFKIEDKIIHFLFPLTLVLITTGYFQGKLKYIDVSAKYIHKDYLFIMKADTIKSDSTFYYIGKTKSNIFFYNTKNNLVTAYPISSIEKMVIGSE